VFVVPAQGVDKTQFINGLEQFNQASDFGSLTIEEVTIDDFRVAIVISELPDSEAATRYSRTVVQNRELYEPLGTATYRNFLISTENFEIFLQEKNINAYMDFYKLIYLGD
jgi:hypothetical protein